MGEESNNGNVSEVTDYSGDLLEPYASDSATRPLPQQWLSKVPEISPYPRSDRLGRAYHESCAHRSAAEKWTWTSLHAFPRCDTCWALKSIKEPFADDGVKTDPGVPEEESTFESQSHSLKLMAKSLVLDELIEQPWELQAEMFWEIATFLVRAVPQ